MGLTDLRVNTKDVDHPVDKKGILYLLEIDVDGQRVVKIGMTCRKIEERVVEILTSHFKTYREFPYCRPKRFRQVDNVFQKEAELLSHFKKRKFVSKKKFSGCQELVNVPIEEVVDVYEEVVERKADENTKKQRRKTKPKARVEAAGGDNELRETDNTTEVGVYEPGMDGQVDGKTKNKEKSTDD